MKKIIITIFIFFFSISHGHCDSVLTDLAAWGSSIYNITYEKENFSFTGEYSHNNLKQELGLDININKVTTATEYKLNSGIFYIAPGFGLSMNNTTGYDQFNYSFFGFLSMSTGVQFKIGNTLLFDLNGKYYYSPFNTDVSCLRKDNFMRESNVDRGYIISLKLGTEF